MAHKQQREFFTRLKVIHPEWFEKVSVIEIGSLNINGSVRDFFDTETYVGVDVGPGPGVDLIALGEEVDFDDDSFDIAVSAECFEHNPEWAATFQNMTRMASQAVLFTCASDGRPEHGTTRTDPNSSPLTLEWDYYRNLNEHDFRDAFDLDAMFSEYAFEYNSQSFDLYFWGIKRVA